MTSTAISLEQLPSTQPFLNSVCPGPTHLDPNVHFSLKDERLQEGEKCVNWPLTGSHSSSMTAKLDDSYLNIARPPLSHLSNESTTYVSLPYHITNLFKKVVKHKDKESEGNMHIAANVNPLTHDPFKIIQLNPGCLSSIIEVNNAPLTRRTHRNSFNDDSATKNPLNKMTNSFNRLLRISASGNHNSSNSRNPNPLTEHYQSLLNYVDVNNAGNKAHSNSGSSSKPVLINSLIDRITSYDADTYLSELRSPTTSKLLISTHVNVLNVIALDSDSNYKNSKQIVTNIPILPFQEADGASSSQNTTNDNNKYNKLIEEPLLRLQFRQNIIVTALHTFVNKNKEPIVLLGFDSGEVAIINLLQLNFQVFDDFGFGTSLLHPDSVSINSRSSVSNSYSSSFGNVAITTIEIIQHQAYEYLIVAGCSNGEVLLLNPYASRSNPSTNNCSEEKLKKSSVSYSKRVVGKDAYITYFKKFDLSPLNKKSAQQEASGAVDINDEEDFYTPSYLVGHFKVSHKPITALASTMPYGEYNDGVHSESQPMILAIGGDDGLVRFVDFIFTYKKNYGNPSDIKNNNVFLTDLVSNYFNDGITDIQFSPDFRFVCIVGKGDLIEIFKITYYNVNGLLTKNSGAGVAGSIHHSSTNVNGLNPATSASGPVGRRSRSGTLNSISSGNLPTAAMFLSPSNTTPSNSFDIARNDHNHTPRLVYPLKELYPPLIKEIKIVGRFKGHTNTVRKIRFVRDDEYNHRGELEPSSFGSSSSVYKLISCGFDGKIIIWEFDYRALPKVKKLPPVENKDKENRDKDNKPHRRSNDETLTAATEDQIEILTSLYKSLYDLRLKRHYKTLAKKAGIPAGHNKQPRYSTIIPPIENDKLVPSIEVPLLSLDLSTLIHDGKIDGFYVDSGNFWCFCKNGDIFRYLIE
ncbi:uncharacterized protein RJT20DRAFT_150203 [Scheffersomyces xylosifermentans]|uniref:uncharacterized protein n=1 Tax=Scheffersomyces xylosifermentans TaxID=1304137 RepID=UPI00315CE2CD